MKTLRLDYYPGTAKSETFAVDRLVVETAPWAGNPSRPIDETNLEAAFRSHRPRVEPRCLFARLFVDLRKWETTGRAQSRGADVPGIAALPDACGARAGGYQEARRAERVSRGLEHAGRSGGQVHRSVHAGIARRRHRLLKSATRRQR
jgi:hypothetical protein